MSFDCPVHHGEREERRDEAILNEITETMIDVSSLSIGNSAESCPNQPTRLCNPLSRRFLKEHPQDGQNSNRCYLLNFLFCLGSGGRRLRCAPSRPGLRKALTILAFALFQG